MRFEIFAAGAAAWAALSAVFFGWGKTMPTPGYALPLLCMAGLLLLLAFEKDRR